MRVPASGESLGYFLRWQVAAFSMGAAAIHFAQISPHFEEYWAFGVFFLVVAWFQAAVAILIVTSRPKPLVVLAATVNLLVVGIWIWSRTTGLPIGPEAGEPEAVGAADLLATVLEAMVVVWSAAILRRSVGSRTASQGLGVVTTALAWTSVAVTTVFAFVAGDTVGMGH